MTAPVLSEEPTWNYRNASLSQQLCREFLFMESLIPLAPSSPSSTKKILRLTASYFVTFAVAAIPSLERLYVCKITITGGALRSPRTFRSKRLLLVSSSNVQKTIAVMRLGGITQIRILWHITASCLRSCRFDLRFATHIDLQLFRNYD